MLSKISREDEFDGGLDIITAEGDTLVVSVKLGGFEGDSFKDVGDKGVHHGHSLLGDTNISMDILEYSVDIDIEGIELLSSNSSCGSCCSCHYLNLLELNLPPK